MFKNILVAFDGSEFSEAGLTIASNWVKRHGGSLFLVHAVDFDEPEFKSVAEQREMRLDLGNKMCCQTKEKVSSQLDKEVESLLCEGKPYEVIVDIADAKNADLIVMGTHGRKGFKKLFMGSVTTRVIVRSPCDVLVAKKPLSKNAGQFKSILLSFDGSELSKKALNRACELSKVEDAEITALYVIPRFEDDIDFIPGSVKNTLMRDAQKNVEYARKLALDQGVSIRTEIAKGSVEENLVDAANRLGTDLIIGGTHGWRGFDKIVIASVMEDVIINAPCPVLIVKSKELSIK